MIVDPLPWTEAPSRYCATFEPNISSASVLLVTSFSPERFALVTASGPVIFNNSIASSLSGTLTPIENGFFVPTPSANSFVVSTTIVRGPGQ